MTTDRTTLWEPLLAHALDILDATPGLSATDWSFGGGTMLMRRHRHRISKDIDIFIADPQFLTAMSPRLNSVADGKTSEYVEQSGFVKLYFEAGEIDFIAAPPITSSPTTPETILGRTIYAETDAEIIAKKVEYRGDNFRARDVFDFACVIEKDASTLEPARATLAANADRISNRLRDAAEALAEDFSAIDVLNYRRGFDECLAMVEQYLADIET